MFWYIFIGIIVLLLIYFLVTFNNLIRKNNKVKEAFSTMDIYLKKRWDLIPNIINIVKGYADHEKETFKEITELRNYVYDRMSDDEKIATNYKLNTEISRLMALIERYPDIKANENFNDLSKQLVKIEDDIAKSRKYFNGTVREFNNKVEMFPSNIIAKMLGYKPKKMFEASTQEKQNINIEM